MAISLSALCMFSAMLMQLLNDSAYISAVRMVLGMEVFIAVLAAADELLQLLK